MTLSGEPRTHDRDNAFGRQLRTSLKARHLVLAVVVALLNGSGPASGHISPVGCNSNDFVLNLTRDKATAHVGDVITYTVSDGNPNSSGSACDVNVNNVTGTRPNATTVTLGPPCTGPFSGAGAGTPVANCGTFTYTIAAADVNPVTNAVTASVNEAGCLHDTAAASGTSCSPDDPESITKTITVTVLIPKLAVTKQCQDAVFGSPMTFSGTVTNTGNTALTVVCTDNQAGQVFSGSLAAGASAPYSGSYTPSTSPSTDTVTCTGTDSLGGTVTPPPTASATCNVTCSPALTVTKACTVNNQPPGQPVTVGGNVTNTGNVQLTNVTCNDSIVGAVTPSSTTLAGGATATYSASYTPTQPSTTDTISCTGTLPAICGGGTVPSNSATATCNVVCSPSISVVKSCTDASSAANPVIAFSGTVTNTGNVELTGLACSDTAAGSTTPLTPSTTTLATPSGQATVSGSYTGNPGSNTDTVSCTASVPAACGGPGTVSAQDSKTCAVPIPPSISTTQNPTSGTLGTVLNDSATLTGSVTPGTLTFTLFEPSDTTCSGAGVFTNVVQVSGPGTFPTSSGFPANAAGVWHWTVVFTSDGTTVSSVCVEAVTITGPVIPTLSEWGMILMVLLLVGIGFLMLSRRKDDIAAA